MVATDMADSTSSISLYIQIEHRVSSPLSLDLGRERPIVDKLSWNILTYSITRQSSPFPGLIIANLQHNLNRVQLSP